MSASRIDASVAAQAMGAPRDTAALQRQADSYRQLLGYLPPRVEARLLVTGALDPALVEMQDQVRAHAMNPACFDAKTAQLMIFGMLMAEPSDAAVIHGIAAPRPGATWEGLTAGVSSGIVGRHDGRGGRGQVGES